MNGWVKSGWKPLVAFGLLFAWGLIYTAAFFVQAGNIKALGAEIDARTEALALQFNDLSRRHDVLLTYVITLREQLSKTGFEVAPMPSLSKPKEQTDEADREEDPV